MAISSKDNIYNSSSKHLRIIFRSYQSNKCRWSVPFSLFHTRSLCVSINSFHLGPNQCSQSFRKWNIAQEPCTLYYKSPWFLRPLGRHIKRKRWCVCHLQCNWIRLSWSMACSNGASSSIKSTMGDTRGAAFVTSWCHVLSVSFTRLISIEPTWMAARFFFFSWTNKSMNTGDWYGSQTDERRERWNKEKRKQKQISWIVFWMYLCVNE